MKVLIFSFFAIFMLSGILMMSEMAYAQEIQFEQIQELEKKISDLEIKISKDISELSEQQKILADLIKNHDSEAVKLAEDIDQSLQQTSTNFWSSALITSITSVSLAIIGIITAVVISITAVKKEEGTSKKYAVKWIFVGFIIGLLGYTLVNALTL